MDERPKLRTWQEAAEELVQETDPSRVIALSKEVCELLDAERIGRGSQPRPKLIPSASPEIEAM